jgi:ATPase family associated with various cellular activities (AAA)
MPRNPFADMRPSRRNHFRLHFYAAVSDLIEQLSRHFGATDAALAQFPFLVGYNHELVKYHMAADSAREAAAAWSDALQEWEAAARCHLPLRALADAANLDFFTIRTLLTIGLVEEDHRFGFVFEHLQGTPGQPRPTTGLLNSWLGDSSMSDGVALRIRALQDLGLVRVANPDAPRSSHALRVPSVLWEAIRGENPGNATSWIRHAPIQDLAEVDNLILPAEIERQVRALPALFAGGQVRALVVRGPHHNGRRTMVGSIAKTMGRDVLEINGLHKNDDERWNLVGPLATLLHAMPVVVLDLAPGETAELPSLAGCDSPVAIVLGKQGGVSGPLVELSLTLTLTTPERATRQRFWSGVLGLHDEEVVEAVGERFRMTSGNLFRAARLARTYAALEERMSVTAADVQRASRELNRQTFDTLAKRVNAQGDWSHLAVAAQTIDELYNLETRCRHRERLQIYTTPPVTADLNSGVRALFHGPSGTGKTLAAQLLAARLQMDLYRLDLSTVVNKYIGETEKNLDKVFARAEELDVILLLDEGDALLTQRTNVQTSNDRYANLETNYLLQRLESFEGILIVTTNVVDRIDSAFQRRMDVMVDFRPPEATERWSIWQMHLPIGHEVDSSLLADLASRCVMTGGQIRNAALHAAVLALDNGEAINSSHLESAVQREYRKMGGVCPLRHISALFAVRQ